ncbi:MAG: hypothetical protein IKI11_05460 [Neisseriaceae bacterium]|nr:hypothetical protein [Neisseriaceae bacterium]
MISDNLRLLADFLDREINGDGFVQAGVDINEKMKQLNQVQDFVNSVDFFYEMKALISFNYQLINFAQAEKARLATMGA